MAHDLRRLYLERVALLESLATTLDREVGEALAGVPHVDRISFRVKGVEEFQAKAAKVKDGRLRYEEPLHEIEDQVAGRVLVFFKRDIATVEAALRATFRTEEIQTKEPVSPAEFDYESQHQVFLVPSHLAPPAWTQRDDLPIAFEMQVRTLFMHAWAEPQHDIGYKPDQPLPRDAARLIAWAAASAWGGDHAFGEALDLLDAQRRRDATEQGR